jgi:hypothetical protein
MAGGSCRAYTGSMRRVVVVFLAPLLMAACAQRQPGRAQPPAAQETESPAETPEELSGASCANVNAGNPANYPEFAEVELESHVGVDRITFRFEPQAGAPDEPPWHFIGFVDELVTEGEGKPVDVEGEAFLLVSFQAIGVDLSEEQPVEVYTGPKEFTPGYGTLNEAVQLGDFEGQVSWGLGLARKACFVLEAEPDHLTLEFPSA